MSSPPPVAVIGAGVSGLAAAYRLRERGLEPVVFEASGRAGGVIRSVRQEGYLVDVGPNTLVARSPVLEALVRSLGLAEERVWADARAARRYVVRDGRPVALPASPLALLTTPLLSARAKARLLREPFVSPPASADESPADESLAAFVRRRLGPEVLDYAVDPFVAGVFAGDPERLSARHAFPVLTALEREHGSLLRGGVARLRARRTPPPDAPHPPLSRLPFSFRGGVQALPDALAARLGGGSLWLRTPIAGMHAEGGGVALRLEGGEGGGYAAAVLAAPPHALAGWALPPGLDLGALADVAYPPVTVLALGFRREDVAHPLDGFGMLVPKREPFRVLGALFTSSLFPDRAPEGHVLLTCFLGGARRPEDGLLPEDEQVALAWADLRRLLGVRKKPAFVLRQAWPRAIPQYEIGYDRVIAAVERLEAAVPGLHVAGTVRGGISVGEAVTAGVEAADRAADRLQG